MASHVVAEPDLQFTKDLIKSGATDLKKCYQCATCSVACKIAPDNAPYPRKEMIWAQWGLKDRLLADPDVWLCHQCNDCSTMCPRGAYPGDVLKAIRKMLIEKLAWPSFMGKLVGESSLFVLTLGLPVVIVLLLTYFSNGFNFSEPTPVHYGEFIPYLYIQVIYTLALLFAVVSLVISCRSYWDLLERGNPEAAQGAARKGFFPSLIEALGEILPHSTFKDCEANNIRYSSHLLAFWGFIGLVITTAIVAFMIDILHLAPPSRYGPLWIPIKILGNAAALAFIIGLTIMVLRRMTSPEQAGATAYFDWFFLLIICGTGLTGVLTEIIRWAGSVQGAYFFYMIHLMFILALFLYLPFSKFAHLGYRTIAIAWGKSVGRDMTVPTEPNYVPPAKPAEEEAPAEA
jgi:quinone-modifying oxidoreductase subunit QmoC